MAVPWVNRERWKDLEPAKHAVDSVPTVNRGSPLQLDF